MRTPNGNAYDREALQEYIIDNGRDPVTGAPLKMDDVVAAPDLAEQLRVYHFKRLMGVRRL